MPGTPLKGGLRLLYEPLAADHAHGLFAVLGDPRVYEHIGDAPAASADQLAAQFALMAAGPPPHRAVERWLNYAVRSKTNGKLIGTLQATIIHQRAEVAYLFGPEFWGRGFATEAMTAFQDQLRQIEHVTEVWATTAPGNTRSIRLLERLGYTPVSAGWPPLLSFEPGDRVFALR